MKFEYLGEDNTFTLELVAYGIKEQNDYMKKVKSLMFQISLKMLSLL